MVETGNDVPSEDAIPTVDWRALRELFVVETGDQARRRRRFMVTVALAAWVAAFVVVWITWDNIAERNVVAYQLPWLASGGLSALVLAIIGGACLVVAFLPADSPGPGS
jgi:hypothetical protein